MDEALIRFRQAADRENGRRLLRRRYSSTLQQQAVEYWQQHRGEEGVRTIAASLGVSVTTLQRWTRALASRPRFRPIEIMDRAPSVETGTTVVIQITAVGPRIEGLTVETTLRQISLLLERENHRLITKTLQLTAELARVRGLPNPEQLALAELQALEQRRAELLAPPTDTAGTKPARPPRPGHGPRAQPTLPVVDIRHERPPDQRACPACGGELTEMSSQTEDAERITTVKLTYQVEQHRRQKYRCACNGAVVTAPGPVQVIPGGRYAPDFGIGVAGAKYADHLPLERQVRMMAREGLVVDSQTLWDQLNAIAHHLEPTYEALGRRALAASVINVDETHWAFMGLAEAGSRHRVGRPRAWGRVLSHLAGQIRG